MGEMPVVDKGDEAGVASESVQTIIQVTERKEGGLERKFLR